MNGLYEWAKNRLPPLKITIPCMLGGVLLIGVFGEGLVMWILALILGPFLGWAVALGIHERGSPGGEGAEVGGEALGLARRVVGWLRSTDAATRVVICIVAFLSGLVFLGGTFTLVSAASSFASAISSGGSLAVAPEGEVPDYEILAEETIGSALSVDLGTNASTEEEFRIIAEDLRHGNAEYDTFIILFHDLEYTANYGLGGFDIGYAFAISDPALAEEQWGDEYTDEEIARILEEDRGVEASAPFDIFD